MKRRIHLFLFLVITASFLTTGTMAQTGLAPDQNPNYMISQNKYMGIADSINTWHSTTIQDTYKAIDFLADRREAREQRRAFRQQLRLERIRYGGYGYYNDFNNFNAPYYYNNFPYYNGIRSYRRGWNGNFFYRNSLPLAVTLGSAAWWWCR